MPSVLSWLDYSEHDRRKAFEVIDLFRERDTRMGATFTIAPLSLSDGCHVCARQSLGKGEEMT